MNKNGTTNGTLKKENGYVDVQHTLENGNLEKCNGKVVGEKNGNEKIYPEIKWQPTA